jgi:hypothetical protein
MRFCCRSDQRIGSFDAMSIELRPRYRPASCLGHGFVHRQDAFLAVPKAPRFGA